MKSPTALDIAVGDSMWYLRGQEAVAKPARPRRFCSAGASSSLSLDSPSFWSHSISSDESDSEEDEEELEECDMVSSPQQCIKPTESKRNLSQNGDGSIAAHGYVGNITFVRQLVHMVCLTAIIYNTSAT